MCQQKRIQQNDKVVPPYLKNFWIVLRAMTIFLVCAASNTDLVHPDIRFIIVMACTLAWVFAATWTFRRTIQSSCARICLPHPVRIVAIHSVQRLEILVAKITADSKTATYGFREGYFT